MIVAQWYQHVLDMNVAKQLATSLLAHLLELYPDHKIFTNIHSDQSNSTNVLPTKLTVLPSITNL